MATTHPDGGGVYRHLIGSGTEQTLHVFHLIDAPADGEGDADVRSHLLDQLREGFPALMRGGDVEIDQLVGTRAAVGGTQLHWVAGIAEIDEVDALDGLPVFDVQTGDNSFC